MSVSMATVRVARVRRSRSSARSAYRPNQNRSASTRGTIAAVAASTGAARGSASPRTRTPVGRPGTIGCSLTTQTSLAIPPPGAVTSTPRVSSASSLTRARPPSIAVYEAPSRTANERSTTFRGTSSSSAVVGAEERFSTCWPT